MLGQKTLIALSALVAITMAMPAQPTLVARGDGDEPGPLVGQEDIISPDLGVAVNGAIDIATSATEAPAPTAAPSLAERADDAAVLARAPAAVTWRITNKLGAPVSTVHARNAGAPGAISGNVNPGTLANGAVGSFAVPTGWAGNVAVVQHGKGRAVVGDESLIEGSFVVQKGMGPAARIALDISYVNGHSVAIVCSCEGKVVAGCNKNLWTLNSCPADNRVGSCKNPTRSNGATSPTKLFAPCRGAAYTYPKDDKATSNGICTSGIINCCIGSGSNCPKNPSQPN
ncbi:hypothetical protein RB595_004225 [Gaeumannomyces hyphopodioides]